MESSHAAFFFSLCNYLLFPPSIRISISFRGRCLFFRRGNLQLSRLLRVSRRQGSKEIQLGVRLVYVEKFTVNFPFFRKTISNRLIAVAGCSMLLTEQKSDRDRFSGSTAFLVSI